MKENIRQVVLQDVVKLVLQSDIDRDGIISKREADILAHRLQISLDVYGIVFDAEKFHRAVGLSPSICGVLAIVQRLLPDDEGEYRRSTFYSLDSEDEDYGVDEGQDDDDDDDDVYDMFYVPVEGEFNRGCAESISMCRQYSEVYGERPSLISLAPAQRKSMNALRVSVSANSLK